MREMTTSKTPWISEYPADWDQVPLHALFGEHKNKNKDGAEQNLLSLSYGNIIRKDINTNEGLLPESFNGYNIIDEGDIVLRLTDLQNDHRSLRTGLVKEHGIITSAYVTLRKKAPLSSEYYHYLLHAFDIMKVFYSMGEGIRQSLGYNELAYTIMPRPSISEQQAIVRYLDSKCFAIDEAIERHKKIIEKLEEYKKIKIASYTSSFHSVKIGRFLSKVQTGPFGSQLHSDEYIENGIAVINPANIQDGEITIDPKCTITEHKAQELIRHLLQVGDIVIGRRGEMGRCAVVKEDGLLCGTGCFVIKCANSLLPDYASLCIRSTSAIGYLTLNAIGTTMLNLNTDIILNCPIPYCDVDTQRSIINRVNNVSSKCNEAVQKHQNIINKLEEYRKSIIYNAVTGKIDCREAVK